VWRRCLDRRFKSLGTVVYGWIGASNVVKELETSGRDGVCKWWLVSASADLFISQLNAKTRQW